MFQKTMVEPYKIFVEAVSTRAGKCESFVVFAVQLIRGFHLRQQMPFSVETCLETSPLVTGPKRRFPC